MKFFSLWYLSCLTLCVSGSTNVRRDESRFEDMVKTAKMDGKLSSIDKKLPESFPKRRLRQLNSSAIAGARCRLSVAVRGDFYSSSNNTWNLNESLLDEIDSDLQSVVDCAIATEATIHISERLQLPVRETINVNGRLNIMGVSQNKANMPIFTCPEDDQIFYIRESSITVLRNLRFENCAPDGGKSPIEARGSNVTIRNCHFSGNAGERGGAVYAARDIANFTALILMDCSFKNNKANDYGGGVFSFGNIRTTITNCEFSGNDGDTGGAVYMRALYSQWNGRNFVSYSACNISNSHFERNSGRIGGALAFMPGSTGFIAKTIFEKNAARYGGAVYLFNDTNVATFDVTFIQNRAADQGGAVYIRSDSAFHFWNQEVRMRTFFRMENSRCIENNSFLGGCVFAVNETAMSITDSLFVENTAASRGGSILSFQAQQLSLNNVAFTANEAEEFGGALSLESPLITHDQSRTQSIRRTFVRINNCTFTTNAADAGGGIFAESMVTLWMTDCIFDFNRARIIGGGVFINGESYDRNGSLNYVFQSVDSQSRLIANSLRIAMIGFGADINQLPDQILPSATARLRNVRFLNNTSINVGGGIVIVRGSLLEAEGVTFTRNWAERAGGIYVLQSLAFIQNCMFSENSAAYSSGAFVVQGIQEGGILGQPIAQGYLKDTLFYGNRAGNYGGGAVVDGLSASMFLVGNVTFKNNEARGGGAISFEIAATLNITDAIFTGNKAIDGGGAIAAMFIQFRENYVFIRDTAFRRNRAKFGGSIQAVFNVHVADTKEPRIKFDGGLIEASITITNTTFRSNTAEQNGGAIHFDGVPALMQDIVIKDSNTTKSGGGLLLMGGSVVKVVNGDIIRNHAADGGGVMMDTRSMLHCLKCDILKNTASQHGGGICLITRPYEPQPVALQCDKCRLTKNSASMGGALHMTPSTEQDEDNAEKDSFVVLRGVEIRKNTAQVGGGAIMASHPANVLFTCSHRVKQEAKKSLDLTQYYIAHKVMNDLQLLSEDKQCPSWIQNRAREGGYGHLEASRAASALSFFETADESSHTNHTVVTRMELVPRLTPIHVTLIDAFGQSPAEPRDRHPDLILSVRAEGANEEIELSGQLRTNFVRGRAVLDQVIIRGKPGIYTLRLELSDTEIKSNPLYVEILTCPIGWTSVGNGTNCEKCEQGTYNFDQDSGTCRKCPDDCTCRSWGIEPNKKYWVPFPCHESSRKCLTEGACDFDVREDELHEFLSSRNPTCNLTESQIEEFQDKQCDEGYTGPLCGSCKDTYGRRGLRCRRCYANGLVLFFFFCALLWFLLVVTISIKGNLRSTRHPGVPQPCGLDAPQPHHPSPETRAGPSQGQSPVQIETREQESPTTSVELFPGDFAFPVDVRSRNLVPNKSRESSAVQPQSGSQSLNVPQTESEDFEKTKRSIAEIFKLFINFAQVNSMALTINVSWSRGILAVLRSLEFLGLTSADAAIALDCLFSTSSSIPRSISREILSLLSPVILLAICVTYWNIRLRNESRDIRNRRIILSAVVILYISYLGITRRLIRILYCIRVADGISPVTIFERNLWTEDTAVECYTGSHAALVGVLVIPMIIVVSVLFPSYSAWALAVNSKTRSLHSEETKEKFGFMFRGYDDQFVYWDSIIMLRKALLALIVGFGYPLGINLQGVLASSVLFICLQIQLRYCPFDDEVQYLNNAEVVSLSVSSTTFFSLIAFNDDRVGHGGRLCISVFVLLLILFFSLYCFALVYKKVIVLCRLSLESNKVSLREDESCSIILSKWITFQFLELFHKLAGMDRHRNQNPAPV